MNRLPSVQAIVGDAGVELESFLSERQFDSERINRFTQLLDGLREHPLPVRLALAEALRRRGPGDDFIRFQSVLAYVTGDPHHYEQLLNYLLLGIRQVDPKVLHYVYWCLQRRLFAGTLYGPKAEAFAVCDVYRFYEAMVAAVRERYAVAPRPFRKRPGPIRRVAAVTNQFVGDRHQPSRDIFDYAWRLQAEQGLEVRLFNTNLMALNVECLFMPPSIAELVTDYEGLRPVEMWGRRLAMASFTDRVFSQTKLRAIVDAIDGFDPDAIVTFGGSCLAADLYAGVRPVLTLPSTSNLTIGLGDALLGYDGTDWTAGIPEMYRDPFERRFRPFTLGFAIPPTDPDRAGDFGLSDVRFVFAVVGTRVDQEAAPFIATFDDVLDACPGAVVVFAGEAGDLLRTNVQAARNAARMRCLGHVADIRALYRRTHAFLNPVRQGGGGSAAFALAEGVPVVTLASGDVAGVAGPEFCVADQTAFIERAARLAGDEEFRRQQAAAAKTRYAEIGDRSRFTAKLLAYCEEARAKYG